MELVDDTRILGARIRDTAAIVQNEEFEISQVDLDFFGAATRNAQSKLREMDSELEYLWLDVSNYLEQNKIKE